MTDMALIGHLRGRSLESMSQQERGEFVFRLGKHLTAMADLVTQLLDERAQLAATPVLKLEVAPRRRVVERDKDGLITGVRDASD